MPTPFSRLIALVSALSFGSEGGVADNNHVEVKQALDWSWLSSKELSWFIKGFNTTTFDGAKHAIHSIRISKVEGEVVFQYKEHDRPGPWSGHQHHG
jgi:hypothetical protein